VQAFHAEDVPLRVPKRPSPQTSELRRIGAESASVKVPL